MAKHIPKILYHYCSVETFYSIIKNRSIWLSDIEKSNDSRELKWLKEKCETYVQKYWLNYVKELDKRGELNSDVFKRYEESKKLSDLINKYDMSKCWVFCLSEKRDDLGQWRGYADDGRGISIGFKSDFFVLVETITHLLDEKEDAFFKKVKYSKKQIEDFFLNEAGLGSISMNESLEETANKIENAIIIAMWNAAFFKSETFKEEREWRIAYSMNLNKLYDGKTPGISDEKNEYKNAITLGKYGYIVKNNSLVSHVELGISHIESIMSEICIGPKSLITVNDVKLFLISQGIIKDINDKSIKICKSDSTYR